MFRLIFVFVDLTLHIIMRRVLVCVCVCLLTQKFPVVTLRMYLKVYLEEGCTLRMGVFEDVS